MVLRDALDLVLADYLVNGKRSADDTDRRIRKHLLRLLDGARELATLSHADLLTYARQRIDERASPASVNREIAFIRRACTLAGEPWPARGWKKLRESAPRSGFFERTEIDRILAQLPPVIGAVVRFASVTGWRRGEVCGLRWEYVDLARGELRLPEGTTKSGEGRVFPLIPQLRDILQERERARRPDCPWVFHRDGKPVRKFYDTWESACRRAGLPGKLFHDLRRSAARTLREAGVDEQTAMLLLGHKTPSIFRRYRIVDRRDLDRAADRLSRFLDAGQ